MIHYAKLIKFILTIDSEVNSVLVLYEMCNTSKLATM